MRLPAFFLLVASAIAQPPPITINQTQVQGGTPGQFLKVNPNRTLGQAAGGGGGSGSPTGCPGVGSIQLYATSTTFGCFDAFVFDGTTLHLGKSDYTTTNPNGLALTLYQTDTSDGVPAFDIFNAVDPAMTGAGGFEGIQIDLRTASAMNKTVGGLTGILLNVGARGANVLTQPMEGMNISLANNGGTTVPEASAIHIFSPNIDVGGGSAITTLHGIQIDDIVDGGTNYAIKTGAGLVQFGGALAISTITPVGSVAAAVCWKTTTTLSYCTSVVGAGGTCTCH